MSNIFKLVARQMHIEGQAMFWAIRVLLKRFGLICAVG